MAMAQTERMSGATLDRFSVIDWQIDDELEHAMVQDLMYGELWLDVIRKTRKWVSEREMRAIISPRATQKGAIILELTHGDFESVFNACIKPQIPYDKIESTREFVKEKFKAAKTEIGIKQPANKPRSTRRKKTEVVEPEVVTETEATGLFDLPF